MRSLLLALLASSPAADYPKPTDDHLNDFAGVVDAETAERLRGAAKAVRRDLGVPIVVITVGSLADWNASGWSVERYATNLYNEWGIGSSESNRGVLLFVAVRDRRVRIAVGQGFGTAFDAPARQILETDIVPRFRSGDYAGGILAGVNGIARALRAGTGAEPSAGGEGEKWTPRGTAVGDPIRGARKGFSIGWIVLLGLGALAIGALFSVLRGGVGAGLGTPGVPRAGMGGWGGLLMGGLGGFLGSALYNSMRGRSSGGHTFGGGSGSSGGSLGGGGSWGGGTSSFGGGFSSGGGASGSW